VAFECVEWADGGRFCEEDSRSALVAFECVVWVEGGEDSRSSAPVVSLAGCSWMRSES